MKKYLLSFLLLTGCIGSINAFQVFVRTLKGKTITIEIENYIYSIRDLKRKIYKKENIPTADQKIIYDGRELTNDENIWTVWKDKRESMFLIERSSGGVSGASLPAERAEREETEGLPATTFTTQQKVGAGITLAALAAAVAGVMKMRSYRNMKRRLIKKYHLGKLTPLQNKVWMATALASYRIPWYLRYLVNNTFATLSDFVGKDPRAATELYYGHEPSQIELDTFIKKFFSNVKE